MDKTILAENGAAQPRVLVVDDNAVNRNVFRALLQKNGIEVVQAESGFACLDFVRKENFDLIFLDHLMPEMDGVETLHRMKEEELCGDVPVIALTANAIESAEEYYRQEGFTGYLGKPVDPVRLTEMIDCFFENHDADEKSSEGNAEALRVQNFPEIRGVDFVSAANRMGDSDILVASIKDFLKISEQHKKLLLDYCEKLQVAGTQEERAEARNSYRIQVHSMKSTAAMIGAYELSSKAQRLENTAGMHNDENTAGTQEVSEILQETGPFLREWEELSKALGEAFGEGEKEKEAVDYEMVRTYLNLLTQAVRDVDLDAMDAISEGLSEYEYPPELAGTAASLVRAIYNIDYDGCLEIAEELRRIL